MGSSTGRNGDRNLAGSDGSSGDHGGLKRARLPTGIPGLDAVLGGGLPRGGICLLSGGPGTGKTVLANQLCFARARAGERCLFVTLLAESHSRMISNLESFEFFDSALLEERIAYVAGARALRDQGFDGLIQLLKGELRRRDPDVLVLDGFRILRQAPGASYTNHTEFFDQLAALLEFTDCTALVSTLSEPGNIAPEHAMADGLIELRQTPFGRRAIRELSVWKLRGSTILDGSHAFEIDDRGAIVYPRTEAQLARDVKLPAEIGVRSQTGIRGLDDMLRGGIPADTTTAVIGAPGSGKTLLGLHFLAAGARRDERGLYFGFYESPDRVIAQGDGIGLGLTELVRDGRLEVMWNRPYEHLVDRVVEDLFTHVKERGIKRVYIDGMEGLTRGAAFPESVPTVLSAATNELRALGATTLLSLEGELLGTDIGPNLQWSAIAENVVVLRYVEIRSHLRRLIWVVKVRGSDFDSSLREFSISKDGLKVAETFESAEAILSGLGRVGEPRGEGGGGGHRG